MTPSAQVADGRRVRRWTRDTIIEKIREWNDRYGEPPCSADWNPSLARWRAQEWRAERYRDGAWPSTNAAKRPFDGSFDAAVRAAGLEPHRPGPRRRLPGEARPLAEQRGPAAPRALADELLAADERARLAEAHAAALERMELLAADAEARVRASEDQAEAAARDAYEARRDARAAETRAVDAEARARSAERLLAAARAELSSSGTTAAWAATREAEARAAVAERRALELASLVCGEQRRLTAAELAELRDGGPSGPAVVASALKALGRARAAGDRTGLAAALGDLASAAVRWRDRL